MLLSPESVQEAYAHMALKVPYLHSLVFMPDVELDAKRLRLMLQNGDNVAMICSNKCGVFTLSRLVYFEDPDRHPPDISAILSADGIAEDVQTGYAVSQEGDELVCLYSRGDLAGEVYCHYFFCNRARTRAAYKDYYINKTVG